MEIQERLKIIMTTHNYTPSVFADEIGVQRSSMSHVLNGRNKPSLDFLEKIIIQFPRVDAKWLITGQHSEKSKVTEEDVDNDSSSIRLETSDKIQVDKSNATIEKDKDIISKEKMEKIKSDSTNDKEIEKVIFIYTDSTFKIINSI